MELAIKCWVLGSPTRQSMIDPEGLTLKINDSPKTKCIPEAEKSPKSKGDHEGWTKHNNRADITSSIHV